MRHKPFVFNRIATIYSLFFNRQVRSYRCILENVKTELDFSTYQSVIDIGCGTGALCKVLQEYRLDATGLDLAVAMLAIAKKKAGKVAPNESCVRFICGDVLNGLPYRDDSFDVAIASYVAHGLMPNERLILYNEMKRVARHTAVLFDYNDTVH